MFNRFTRAARAVVVCAREEAVTLGHHRVGSEHLLLAIAAGDGLPASLGIDRDGLRAAIKSAPGDGLDAGALAAIGIDLDSVRRSAEQAFGTGALGLRRGRPGHVRFSRGAKRALERSLREAVALHDRHIGPEHILLGLMSEADSSVAGALRSCGTSPAAVRAAALAARQEAA